MATELTLEQLKAFLTNYIDINHIDVHNYQATTEAITGLINKIGLQIRSEAYVENILSVFDYGKLPLGQDIEEYLDELLLPEAFSNGSPWTSDNVDDALAPRYPIVDKSYSIGQDPFKFAKSYPIDQVEKAFISSEALASFTTNLLKGINDSLQVAKENLTKKLLGLYADKLLNNGLSTENLAIPNDEDSAKSFLNMIKNDISLATFKRQDTSIGGATGVHLACSRKEDLVLVLNYKVINNISTYARSSAYNVADLDYGITTIVIDDIANADALGANTPIIGMLVDRRAIRVYENIGTTLSQINAAARYETYFYHSAFTTVASPFYPAHVYIAASQN
jgi:hypothetical protein